MKKRIVLFLICFQFVASFTFAQNKLEFSSIERSNGTAFFSMDNVTGQVYFMLDNGIPAGVWKAYGKTIAAPGGNLLFSAATFTGGTAFFAMNKTTCQVFFMLDFGTEAGIWKNFGNTIPNKLKTEYTFSVHARKEGTAFFSQDLKTGQVYFMLDHGSNQGKWKAYGAVLKR